MKKILNGLMAFSFFTMGLEADSNFKVGAYYENWAFNRKDLPYAGRPNNILPGTIPKPLSVVPPYFAPCVHIQIA